MSRGLSADNEQDKTVLALSHTQVCKILHGAGEMVDVGKKYIT
jgi:hypothetical protein